MKKLAKMQGKRKFYDIEDDQNPLTNNIPLRKTKRSKKMPKDQTKSKSAYLSKSKAKAKQFQRQPKKIQESDEKLQEEDREYLIKQNVDRHSDSVSNKTIEKNVDKHLTKHAGDNLDKSSEFIFDDSEEKIETKKFKNSKVDAKK